MQNHFHQAEYCDMNLVLGKTDLEHFIGQLASGGVSLYWKDRHEDVVLVATTGIEKKEFHFQPSEDGFVLTGSVILQDKRLVNALQYTLIRTKGEAVVKQFSEGPILISKFANGEALHIMELHGPRKKVVYEKPIRVSSEDVIRAFKSRDIEQRIPVLKLEMDYELVSLADAMQAGDPEAVRLVKVRLEELRRELMLCEAFDQHIPEVLH
ncbi:hypothetical protein [Tumebacillus permanentifrigoris]|uniref:Uncharacterized protein n=1 Tax=Tumebacillus permanentifrigoris TaxID=378543 RepID=A0A316DVR1_9BACL|nr:hypothetical protein [Tumebacillus permanentifrigoris]PWK13435.1 hypothetical protein C7459_107103 [Tumebacillus permanentifrigoris]